MNRNEFSTRDFRIVDAGRQFKVSILMHAGSISFVEHSNWEQSRKVEDLKVRITFYLPNDFHSTRTHPARATVEIMFVPTHNTWGMFEELNHLELKYDESAVYECNKRSIDIKLLEVMRQGQLCGPDAADDFIKYCKDHAVTIDALKAFLGDAGYAHYFNKRRELIMLDALHDTLEPIEERIHNTFYS